VIQKMPQIKKPLKNKLSQAIKKELDTLPSYMQTILVDDLITAFESRLAVMNRVKTNEEFAVKIGLQITH
jgi:hypothetical protein